MYKLGEFHPTWRDGREADGAVLERPIGFNRSDEGSNPSLSLYPPVAQLVVAPVCWRSLSEGLRTGGRRIETDLGDWYCLVDDWQVAVTIIHKNVGSTPTPAFTALFELELAIYYFGEMVMLR